MPSSRCSREKMRIAYFTSQFPKLSEGFVINQIVGALQAGHEIDILTRHAHDGPPWSQLVDAHNLLDQTQVIKVRASHAHTLSKVFGKRLARRIINCHNRYQSNAHYPKPAPRDAPLGKYDIIHAQFGNLGNYALALRNAGIIEGPILTAFRGVDITQRIKERGTSEYLDLFKNTERFLPSCAHFKELLIKLGCPQDKIHVLYSGVDTERFPFHDRNFSDGPLRLLSLCRLVPKKGIACTLHALAQLKQRGTPFTYTIAGDGPERTNLEQLSHTLGLTDSVHFCGAVANNDVCQLYCDHHIFLATSITPASRDQDGAANSPKEAALTGMPIIVSAHGGLSETVNDPHSGRIVPENDFTALADTLISWNDNREQLAGIGRNGASYSKSKFEITALNKQMLQIYKDCAESASSSRQ